ncbi:AKP8L protein, partial [Rhinopomastus cyanomelas]|nr:AKP8L protein [Rhinopomastus cyanomelas]
AGYEGYGYGYGYGQESSASYGYGVPASNSWELANSDLELHPEGSVGAGSDAVAKINLDNDPLQGGHYGSERYDSYDSYDSRPSLNDRDPYRSGYDYGESDHHHPEADGSYEGHYDGFYGNRRDHQYPQSRIPRERGHNWGREGRGARSMGSPYPGRMGGGGQWNELPQGMGSRGGPPGSSRLPSLFSHNILPEPGMFPGSRGFSGNLRYGGGMMKQRMRRHWKTWDSEFRPQKKKLKKDPTSKKRKQPNSSDEPDGKAAKTDGSDNSDSDNEEGTEGESGEKEEKEGSRGEGEDEEGRDPGALSIQEEISQIKRKLQAGKKIPDRQKKRHRDRMVERIQFVCSLCKFRTFYEDEMSSHLESRFHKEHFKFVGTKLPQQTADFLQEYVANKTRKTEERRKAIDDINGVIQQIYRDQDLTQDIGMEHFIKKVEAAHCAACDLFIPMQFGIIQKHLKSLDHNHNRRAMMEQSKKSSLVVARSILNNKLISKKLERYLKGENPFTDDPEEKEEPEEGEGGAAGTTEEGAAEGADENKEEEEEEEENLEEENPEGENLEEEETPVDNPEQGTVDEENKDPGETLEGEGEKTGTDTQAQSKGSPEEEEEQEEDSPATPKEEEQQQLVEGVEIQGEEEEEEEE